MELSGRDEGGLSGLEDDVIEDEGKDRAHVPGEEFHDPQHPSEGVLAAGRQAAVDSRAPAILAEADSRSEARDLASAETRP